MRAVSQLMGQGQERTLRTIASITQRRAGKFICLHSRVEEHDPSRRRRASVRRVRAAIAIFTIVVGEGDDELGFLLLLGEERTNANDLLRALAGGVRPGVAGAPQLGGVI